MFFSQSQSVKAAANLKFAFPLYEEVKKSHSQNFVLSPLSVRNAMAMVSFGAAGKTAEEIREFMQSSKSENNLIKEQANLLSSLKGISSPNSGVEFVTADKIYANAEFRVKTQFENDVQKLGGEIETMDFSQSEEAAGKINQWVQNKTAGKIPKIVGSEELSSKTSILVLNSIYFKGMWKNAFKESSTSKLSFFINENKSVMVDMMKQENEFQFTDLKKVDAKVILLPYKNPRLSMMIYVPAGSGTGALEALENWLKNQSPVDIQQKHFGRRKKVLVFLPKFTIRSTLQLNEPLKSLGLREMFDSATADFSGIFEGSGRFFVSKVSQETFIKVNEVGTEAAAVTAVGGLVLNCYVPVPQFKVDRPFLFQIVDSETKSVLFMGRVKDPRDV